MVIDIIKRAFSINANSFYEFVKIIGEKDCEFIKIELYIKRRTKFPFIPFESSTDGFVGNFRYGCKYSSQVQSLGLVVLKETYAERAGSSEGIADYKNRREYAMKLFATIEDRLREIKSKLPNVETILVGPMGNITEEDYEAMRAVIRENQICSFLH